MPSTINPQSAQVPIGFWTGADGRPVQVYINPSWYRFIVTQLVERLGGVSGLTITELVERGSPMSGMGSDDEDEPVRMIPGPQGEQGEPGQMGRLFVQAEELDERPPMPRGLWEALALTAGVMPKAAAGGGLEDGYIGLPGVYTPTLTNVANLDGSTAYEWMYIRFGSVVLFAGAFDADPTAGASTQLGFSLPIASNIGAAADVSGVAFASGIAGQGAAILGDAANNRGTIQWVAVDTTNQPMYAVGAYKIL